MVVKIQDLITQAKLQFGIHLLGVISERIMELEDVHDIRHYIAIMGMDLCNQEEDITRSKKLNDYDFTDIELDLPDELIRMTFEEIEQYYEDSKSDDIVKDILENVSKNMEESDDVRGGEE